MNRAKAHLAREGGGSSDPSPSPRWGNYEKRNPHIGASEGSLWFAAIDRGSP